MASRGIAIVRAHLARLPAPETLTLGEIRTQYDRAARVFPVPSGVAVAAAHVAGVPVERLVPAAARPGATLLYLHGGGYCIGSPRSHRHLAAAIGAAAGMATVVPDYRLAPEHAFPAALDDAVAVYRGLLADGVAPSRLVVAGDSAGGGLAIAMLTRLRDEGVPLPAAAVCLSPWVDLTCTAATFETKAAVDPIVRRAGAEEMARAYLAGQDATTPLASPLFAGLAGLPPLLVQVGTDEVLLDDADRLVARARAAGVDVTRDVWDGMIHVWPWFTTLLDEAPAAVAAIGAFVAETVDG